MLVQFVACELTGDVRLVLLTAEVLDKKTGESKGALKKSCGNRASSS